LVIINPLVEDHRVTLVEAHQGDLVAVQVEVETLFEQKIPLEDVEIPGEAA
jgi:hypothetical protein